jgi:hypothetical protein
MTASHRERTNMSPKQQQRVQQHQNPFVQVSSNSHGYVFCRHRIDDLSFALFTVCLVLTKSSMLFTPLDTNCSNTSTAAQFVDPAELSLSAAVPMCVDFFVANALREGECGCTPRFTVVRS